MAYKETLRNAIPSFEELEHYMDLTEDPLDEEGDIPLGGPRTIIHRYPDWVLLFVSVECAMYCRFCTRKRKVGDDNKNPSMQEILKGIEYVAEHEDIRVVLISGGDPLLIPARRPDEILGRLRAIPHLDLVRIGTRVPCVWSQKIIEDAELVEVLRKHTPRSLKEPQFFINTHFNHPNEITEHSYQAVKILRDLGYSEAISEDRRGGVFTSAIELGKVYVNDPIERIEGKPSRHNPNRK